MVWQLVHHCGGFVRLRNEKQAEVATGSVDVLLICASAEYMAYMLFLSVLAVRGSYIMVGLPHDDVKFSPFGVVSKNAKFVGSNGGRIQDIKDMLDVASK